MQNYLLTILILLPVIGAATPAYPYEPGTWGPSEAFAVTPPGGWLDPSIARETESTTGATVLEKAS